MNTIHDCLFALLRGALRKEPVAKDSFASLSAEAWRSIYKLAARQGVLALAYDGLKSLPAELCPPRDVLFGWAVNTEKIENCCNRQSDSARALFKWCEELGLHPILLKGIALSRFYPIPEHRPCGDIDIYLGEAATTFDELMQRQGVTVDTSGNEKHSVLIYRSVMVENHHTFLDTSLYRIDRLLEEYLRSQEPLSEVRTYDGMRFRVLPPTADALFLLRHTARHLERGIGLRHLCDWVLFVQANRTQIDWNEFDRYTEKLKLRTFYRILSGIASEKLMADGLPQPDLSATERQLQDKVLRYILDYQSERVMSRNPCKVVHLKIRHLLERRWVMDEVLECSFAGHVWRSAMFHLRNPRSIFTTKV